MVAELVLLNLSKGAKGKTRILARDAENFGTKLDLASKSVVRTKCKELL